jgi:hypothetical protein
MAVDQLLFGYRDGHELIAGSRPLAAVQQRELLPHIDASFEAADERQLVGAAIPSLDGYLLARIWPAPERPRRGAVWAHALLLSAEQLRFRRLDGLLTLLRRPVDEHLDGYGHRLPWPREVELSAVAPPPLAEALARAAHAGDPRPRVVLWHAARDAEPALLALLDAFPGAARSAFSFRTRERARLGATAYRLQVASVLSGQAGGASAVVIDARQPPSASSLLAS